MRYARQILAVLIGLGLLVLLIVLVVKGFSGTSSTPTTSVDMVKYANTTAVAELYVDGPVVLDQDHRALKIDVSQSQIEVDVIQGYQGTVIKQQVFPSNATAYAIFLQSLNRLNFAKGNGSAAIYDERGYCAQQDRFIYQLTNEDKNIFRYWSTSCGQGTFGGNRPAVRELFLSQIPTTSLNLLANGIPLN